MTIPDTTRAVLPIEQVPPRKTPHRRGGQILAWLAGSAAAISGGLGLLVACAACCLPLLVGAGFLTGAAAAGLQSVFLGAGAVLMLAAGAVVLVRRRRAQRTGQAGCGDDCAC